MQWLPGLPYQNHRSFSVNQGVTSGSIERANDPGSDNAGRWEDVNLHRRRHFSSVGLKTHLILFDRQSEVFKPFKLCLFVITFVGTALILELSWQCWSQESSRFSSSTSTRSCQAARASGTVRPLQADWDRPPLGLAGWSPSRVPTLSDLSPWSVLAQRGCRRWQVLDRIQLSSANATSCSSPCSCRRHRWASSWWPAGPSGIPGYPGIPGLIWNPDPGILENLIPGFFGIYPIKQNSDFKDFYWVLTQICPKNPGIPSIPGWKK